MGSNMRCPRVELAPAPAQAALDHGPQIGDYVSEHIGGDDHIEPLGFLTNHMVMASTIEVI